MAKGQNVRIANLENAIDKENSDNVSPEVEQQLQDIFDDLPLLTPDKEEMIEARVKAWEEAQAGQPDSEERTLSFVAMALEDQFWL